MISCKERALKLITIKDRTQKELTDKLKEKGYREEEIEEVILFLKEYKYIDDFSYAQKFTRDAQNLKKWGKSKIIFELSRKGIDKETAQSVTDEFCTDEEEILDIEIQKRFKNSDLSNEKERARIFGYFARRGFSPSEIKGAINRACSFEDILPDD